MADDGITPVTTDDMLQFMVFMKQSIKEVKGFSERKENETIGLIQNISDIRTCLSEIKIRIERMDTEQTGYMEARRDRTFNCDKLHDDFEKRLRSVPGGESCKLRGERLDKIEDRVEKITPFIYKLVGGVAVLAIVIPPLVTSVIGAIIAFFHNTTTP